MNNYYTEASVLKRCIAYIVDFVVSIIIVIVLQSLGSSFLPSDAFVYVLFILLLIKDVFGGRSLGKRLLSIHIRSAYDQTKVPNAISLVLRNLITLLMPFVDFIFMIINKRNQKVGDLITGCVAITFVRDKSRIRVNKTTVQSKIEQTPQRTDFNSQLDVDYSKWDSLNKDLQFNQPPDESRHNHIKLGKRRKVDYNRDYIKENDWE